MSEAVIKANPKLQTKKFNHSGLVSKQERTKYFISLGRLLSMIFLLLKKISIFKHEGQPPLSFAETKLLLLSWFTQRSPVSLHLWPTHRSNQRSYKWSNTKSNQVHKLPVPPLYTLCFLANLSTAGATKSYFLLFILL